MTTIPSVIPAGNSINFTINNANYKASTWSLTYTLVNSSHRYTFSGIPDGDAHLVSVSGAITATWESGKYNYYGVASDGAEDVTIDAGTVTIKPALTTPGDHRTHAQIMLDVIEAVLEGRITDDVQAYSINGKSVTQIPVIELRILRDRYKDEVYREQRAARLARGENISNSFKVRFK